MSISADELHKLSVVERLELIEVIWDSIVDESSSVPITEAQRREIDRRLDGYARQRPGLSTWDEVRARLELDE